MVIGQKKAPKPGRDRVDMSKRVIRGGKVVNAEEEAKRGGKRGRAMPVIFVAVFCLCFAFLYSEFYVDTTALMSFFDDRQLNRIFFGPGYGDILGDPLVDQLLTLVLRGGMFMALFGLSPLLTFASSKIADTSGVSFYYRNWVVLSLAAFVFALLQTVLVPLVAELFGVFTLETG